MALYAKIQEAGEQSLLELPLPRELPLSQPAPVPSRKSLDDDQPSHDPDNESARSPAPLAPPAGERRIVELPRHEDPGREPARDSEQAGHDKKPRKGRRRRLSLASRLHSWP